MVPGYLSPTIRKRKIVIFIHICGDRAISLLPCVRQETESDSLEMVIRVAPQISTQKYTKDSMQQGYSYSTIKMKKC